MALAHRTFATYDEYVRLQGGKAREQRDRLLAEMPGSIRGFEHSFQEARPFLNQGPVLCLGARTGAEVIAAVNVGFIGSIGIDLHPVGPGVLPADWHAMPFDDASFPNIYSNSFDHCLFLEQVTAEIRRVLVPAGVFYLMASDKGAKSARGAVAAWLAKTNSNEALFWQHSDELCAAVVGYGFELVTSWRAGVWGHYVLRVRR